MALLEANQPKADAIALRKAMKGNYEGWDLGISGIGSNDPEIMEIMRDQTPENRKKLQAEYARLYPGSDLITDAHDELEEDWKEEQFDALHAGKFAHAVLGLRSAGAGAEPAHARNRQHRRARHRRHAEGSGHHADEPGQRRRGNRRRRPESRLHARCKVAASGSADLR